MLILPDSKSLGDTFLSPEENVAKLREGNKKMVQDRKIPNQSLLENQDMALGNPLDSNEFMRRIRLMAPKLIVKEGGVAGAIQIRAAMIDPSTGVTFTKYVTGFYKGVLPEFSSVLTDENGLSTREIRGWRTCLLVMIHCGVVPYADVKAAFGDPLGERGILWREQVQGRQI